MYRRLSRSRTTFSVPFKYIFPRQVTLCAYSVYITDTAAAASIVVGVSARVPGNDRSSHPGLVKPVNTALPTISRSGKTLTCIRGSWRNA